MKKSLDTGEMVIGNDIYEGYCKDLADLIAKKLGISCKFTIIIIITKVIRFISAVKIPSVHLKNSINLRMFKYL